MQWIKKNSRRRIVNDAEGEEATTISITPSQQTASQANRIYFYSCIDVDTVLELNKQIDEAAKQMQIVKISLDLPEPPPIKLFINSPGGDLASSMCVADKIINCPVPVHTYCEGEAASGATLISVSGKKRFMSKHSFFLIHQLSSEIWGNYLSLEEEMKNLTMMMDAIKSIYLTHTEIPEKELDELLKHDLYLSPDVCLKWKFVDSII